MSYRVLDPRNLRIDEVDLDAQRAVLHFQESNIEKVMDNADQRTLWTQAGTIEMWTPRLSADLPAPPFLITHTDVDDGLYTQRDMMRIPLDVSGEIVLSLWFEGRDEPLRMEGSRMCLHLEGDPSYVRHVD